MYLCVFVFEAGITHTERGGGKDRGILKFLYGPMIFSSLFSQTMFSSFLMFSLLSPFIFLCYKFDGDVKG